MAINVNQSNKSGANNASVSDSNNSRITISTKILWRARAGGFLAGIVTSILASYIYDLLKNL